MRAAAISKEEHKLILKDISDKRPDFTGTLHAATIEEDNQERIITYGFRDGKITGAHEEVRIIE